MMLTDMDIIEKIFALFTEQGGNAYIGEPVTQLEHALQAGVAARRHKARATLVTAALLHDVGHFLHHHHADCADDDIDSEHEKIGEQFLRLHFQDEVAELVKHHVNAKRYLCATDTKYLKNLSDASHKSLLLQGGPMREEEANEFARHPLFADILLLRRWDEGAKLKDKQLPDIRDFRTELASSLL